jgi:hypothetical protein
MLQFNYVLCQGCHKAVRPRYGCGSRNSSSKVIFHIGDTQTKLNLSGLLKDFLKKEDK